MLEPVRNERKVDGGSVKPLTNLDRLPPQNIEAEQSVLGAVLLENEAIATVIEHLTPGDFYKEAHRKIFIAMLELYEKNEPIDLITLTEQLNRKELLEEMPPFLYGGGMIEDVTIEKSIWAKLPGKFEAGTPDIAGAYGMKAAVEYLEKVGMDEIRKHEKELTNHALERIQEIKGINVHNPKNSEKQVGIILFTVDGMDAHDVALALDEAENIAIRSGYHCAHPLMSKLDDTGLARASFYLYNTKEEIDLFIDTLKTITDAFAKSQ